MKGPGSSRVYQVECGIHTARGTLILRTQVNHKSYRWEMNLSNLERLESHEHQCAVMQRSEGTRGLRFECSAHKTKVQSSRQRRRNQGAFRCSNDAISQWPEHGLCAHMLKPCRPAWRALVLRMMGDWYVCIRTDVPKGQRCTGEPGPELIMI